MPEYELSFTPKGKWEEFEYGLMHDAIQRWSDIIGADLVLTIANHRETSGLMLIPHHKWPMDTREVLDILRHAINYIENATEAKT